MKKSRKLNQCLNCGKELSKEYNFCPNCGQENKDQKVSIFRFVQDFFSNYLNFEAVFFRTLPAFFFHPGRLTNTFNEGKRRQFIHPIRLYLISSLFYFFVASLAIPGDVLDRIMSGELTPKNVNNQTGGIVKFNIDDNNILDSLEKSGDLEELRSLGVNLDTSKSNLENLQAINQVIEDTLAKGKSDWIRLRRLSIDPEISDTEFDSTISKTSFDILNSLGSEQRRRFIANSGLFISSAIQNLPVMMFILLPFFAFLLWLLYIRSHKYYVEHLIHGLHLHSFAYMIYGLGILWIVGTGLAITIAYLICFLWVTIYTYLSLKNVSQQGWFKTLFKLCVLGLFYFTVLSAAVVLELYISLMIF
ncbi:hypothetical protein ALPR1_16109 [Algoriphagus machipongonensis]|uniref:Zinc-ribbon domain-containing protein n=1 Tax=Algoriphagus machipongonensis TaxID=388413 RepID=A3I123_9BACT|nr:hypothetical protein ALPR1_16109 [Algoriphagus machipongonensis]